MYHRTLSAAVKSLMVESFYDGSNDNGSVFFLVAYIYLYIYNVILITENFV